MFGKRDIIIMKVFGERSEEFRLRGRVPLAMDYVDKSQNSIRGGGGGW
jgi:hypothetical protein